MVTELASSTGASETENETLEVCVEPESSPPQPESIRAGAVKSNIGKTFISTTFYILMNYGLETKD